MFSLDRGLYHLQTPGTSVCVRDFSAPGTDGTAATSLPCDSDFRGGDIVNLFRRGALRRLFHRIHFLSQRLLAAPLKPLDHTLPVVATSGSHVVGPRSAAQWSACRVTIAGGEVTGAQLLSSGYRNDQLTSVAAADSPSKSNVSAADVTSP